MEAALVAATTTTTILSGLLCRSWNNKYHLVYKQSTRRCFVRFGTAGWKQIAKRRGSIHEQGRFMYVNKACLHSGNTCR